MKQFCIRFDVDTYKCLSEGAPHLLDLGRELGAHFTFFVSMGRAVSRMMHLAKLLSRKTDASRQPTVHKLPNLYKLGLRGYLVTALLNPKIGSTYTTILNRLAEHGHELGLHGGKNHAHWQADGDEWTQDRLLEEIGWGVAQMEKAGLARPVGFSSPGWKGSSLLDKALVEYGFEYVADAHGCTLSDVTTTSACDSLRSIPTNILGQPGGVGFLEYWRARNGSDKDILDDIEHRLNHRLDLAVMYDHPYYAGVQEISLLRQIILKVRQLGYSIVLMKEVR